MVPDGTEPIGNTQTSTILLGDHLIIHVMSSRKMRGTIKRWQLLPDAAPAMTQIWPTTRRRVDWPGAVIVRGATVEKLAYHFFKHLDLDAQEPAFTQFSTITPSIIFPPPAQD